MMIFYIFPSIVVITSNDTLLSTKLVETDTMRFQTFLLWQWIIKFLGLLKSFFRLRDTHYTALYITRLVNALLFGNLPVSYLSWDDALSEILTDIISKFTLFSRHVVLLLTL